jgi:hypothetical protein
MKRILSGLAAIIRAIHTAREASALARARRYTEAKALYSTK